MLEPECKLPTQSPHGAQQFLFPPFPTTTQPHYVAQASLKLAILLHPSWMTGLTDYSFHYLKLNTLCGIATRDGIAMSNSIYECFML